MTAPTRPVLRWHGGKWRLAPWIIAQFPPHRVYVEPFGGAASVLLRKARCYAEVYNDLDGEAVNLFRVLRDEHLAARLVALLRLTPFARDEFNSAYDASDDPVERARRLVVLSFMGFGSNAHALGANDSRGRTTGFRANSSRSGTTPAHDWAHYPDALAVIVARLTGVVIENRPALEVMAQHDGPATLHYVDPPYVHATRAPSNKYDLRYRMYRHEMADMEHVELLEFLQRLEGLVVLSGYPSALYEAALPTLRRISCPALADGARPRTEVLWINPAAADALGRRTHPLLAAVTA
jgi:DNA adenine methylase